MVTDTIVVAGNGASLARIDPGRILQDDFVIRTNNFFFETHHYLGQRVDLAIMGGDPRVAPFMFETLWRSRAAYDLRAWSSFNPRVKKAGQRRFGSQFRPMRYRDRHVESALQALMIKYQCKPTTGTYALLAAHAQGRENVILAGMDLYQEEERYPYHLGRHYRDLMGADLNQRGLDTHLHDLRLDAAIVDMLRERGDVRLMRSVKAGAFADQLPLAPIRAESKLEPIPHRAAPVDWASRSGIYPIVLLKALRRASAWKRGFRG